MNTPKPKNSILKISPYKAGLTKTGNNKKVIKLSSNENPFGASPKAIQAYLNSANTLHRYPEANLLNQVIADTYNLKSSGIVCGAGSDEIISLICQAYTNEGDDVLYSQYGFLMYPISAMAAGANPISVPETNLKTDINAIIKAVTPKTKIIFIANPNNPTGSYLTKDEINYLQKNIPAHVLLVLDGAYAEYANVPDYSDGIELVNSSNNTIVTRTFSKIYGLASLRIGWCYASDEISDILNRVRGPFNVSGPAINAATAALEDSEFIIKAKKHNEEWKKWLSEKIASLGIKVYPTIANFILTKFENEEIAKKAHEFLMNEGIIARPVANYGLKEYIRFTIGLREDNEMVYEILQKFMLSLK